MWLLAEKLKAKEPLKGDAAIKGWADFKVKGMFSGPKYSLKKGWGGKFATPTKKFEFYSEALKAGLLEHAKKYETDPGDVSYADVLKMNPLDGARLGLKTGDRVKISSMAGSITSDHKLWEGIRPGTVTKCFGQGHWAYGRVAAKDYAKATPSGGNDNEILVDDCDRLSGAMARNGGFTGVKIVKA